MKQQFLQVWKDGELWYEFPAENEDNVRADLMNKNLDRICEIKAPVADVQVLKANIAKQETIVELPSPKATKPTKSVQPKAAKAKQNDPS
jgi:hypothetical protein